MPTKEAPAPAAELVTIEQSATLAQAPVLDGVHPRKLALIRKMVAENCSDAETAFFLEIIAKYGLDWEAREAWCARSKTKDGRVGKLLIMVGRDGLRKIVTRNGLWMDGDVIHENDEFQVVRTPDGNRTIAHSYGLPTTRGPVVAAWAEVRLGGPDGQPMGYFIAPLSEYLPKNVSEHSPWSKQVSVMCLACAERQAARQATPLSGLLVEGEDEVIDGTAEEVAAPELTPGFWDDVAERAGADITIKLQKVTEDWEPARLEMTLAGLDHEGYARVLAEVGEDVRDHDPEPDPEDADVVQDVEPEDVGGEDGEGE